MSNCTTRQLFRLGYQPLNGHFQNLVFTSIFELLLKGMPPEKLMKFKFPEL